jgi:geranylgeranyl diphosphate synthase, type II
MQNIKKYFDQKKSIIEKKLDFYLDKSNTYPPKIHEAMRYSVLNGGKRLRAILVLLGNNSLGGKESNAYPACAAVEFVHAYSLIHDDLPSLDNDDYRRGKLTSHKKFGEAIAILAGDALLTKGFEVLGNISDSLKLKKIIIEFSNAIGSKGMIGGQIMDLECENKKFTSQKTKEILKYIHKNKTAALIQTSLVMGGILGNASNKKIKILREYGLYLGLLFQITDDILDVIGDKKKLGKRGSDKDNNKLTYPSCYGIDESKKIAEDLASSAHKIIRGFNSKSRLLLDELVDYVLERTY